MDEIRLPQHIVDRIERRWTAKWEQMTAASPSRPEQGRRSPSSAK
jgi:hypothetical protein